MILHRLLVYEFMKNGFLDKWIFPSKHCRDRLLDWGTRFHIAIATAQGIAYFHEQCRNRIIHCDIKPENILLDENFYPKVSDFGLAKLMGREHWHVITMVRRTSGYLAPEWVSNRLVTVKADVYSTDSFFWRSLVAGETLTWLLMKKTSSILGGLLRYRSVKFLLLQITNW